MFRAADIQARLRQQPFVPVRITTTSGQEFDIFHPDLVLVGTSDLTIGFASTEDPSIYSRVTRVAILHVTAMEDLPNKTSAGGNGKADS
jgi:hypothetical protein